MDYLTLDFYNKVLACKKRIEKLEKQRESLKSQMTQQATIYDQEKRALRSRTCFYRLLLRMKWILLMFLFFRNRRNRLLQETTRSPFAIICWRLECRDGEEDAESWAWFRSESEGERIGSWAEREGIDPSIRDGEVKSGRKAPGSSYLDMLPVCSKLTSDLEI